MEDMEIVICIVAVFIGHVLRTFLPYYIKRREEKKAFDYAYAYDMMFGFAMSAVGVVLISGTEAILFNIPTVILLVFGGAGVQDTLNRGRPTKKVSVDG